jgi:TRAP-type C4-dicarboxylate transport system permease small subunit
MDRDRPFAATDAGPYAAFRRLADGIALAGGYAAVLCLAALLALVTAEILMSLAARVFKGLPPDIGIAWEYSAYLMGIAFLLGSGLTLRAGMHVRIEMLLRAGKGRLLKPLEVVSALVGVAFSGFLAWSLTRFTLQSYSSGQVSGESLTPLWIPQSALSFGAAVLFVQMLLRLVAAVLDKPLEDKSFGVATLPE